MISATLDTNVYVRAFHFGGGAALLIGYARVKRLRVDISEPIIAETSRVLRVKFQWDGYMIGDLREKLLSLGNLVMPTVTLTTIQEDPDDNRILSARSRPVPTSSSARTKTCCAWVR